MWLAQNIALDLAHVFRVLYKFAIRFVPLQVRMSEYW